MPAKVFNPEMEEFLEKTIHTGLKGRIYEVIVEKKTIRNLKFATPGVLLKKSSIKSLTPILQNESSKKIRCHGH